MEETDPKAVARLREEQQKQAVVDQVVQAVTDAHNAGLVHAPVPVPAVEESEEEENPFGDLGDVFDHGDRALYKDKVHEAKEGFGDRTTDYRQPKPSPMSSADEAALDQRWEELKADKAYQKMKLDPDHGGKDTKGSREEALIGLDLHRRGVGPFAKGVSRPEGLGHGDLMDGDGQLWDVKSVSSKLPGELYSDEKLTELIEKQLARNINVIVDTRKLNQTDITKLAALLKAKGWGGSVICYP